MKQITEQRLKSLLPNCEVQVWQPTQYPQIDIFSEKAIEVSEEITQELDIRSLSFWYDHIQGANRVTIKLNTL